MLLNLLHHVALLMIIAYIFTRTKIYYDIIEKKFTCSKKFFLIIVFGLLSIYGTMNGVRVGDAVANIRDLGPVIAGFLAGPVVGMGAGLIGASHRFYLGGSTALPCALATFLAGLLAGLVYLLRKGRFIGFWGAVLFILGFEIFHCLLVIIILGTAPEIISIVRSVILPMALSNSLGMAMFIFLSQNLIRERKNEQQKEKIESELQVAHDIQMGIIPKMFPPFPQRKEFDIFAWIKPAKQVGGDFYDFFFLNEELLCLVIADVSGKGVPAALFMAVTKTLIKSRAAVNNDPASILSEVNRDLCEENDSVMFVTVFLAILNVKNGELLYSPGGHNLPYLLGNKAVKQLRMHGGIALGVLEDAEFSTCKTKLLPGDLLFLYTDGVNEAMNKSGELFDYPRLEKFLGMNPDLTPRDLILALSELLVEFTGTAEQSDDITMLALQYLGE
ncbi:MAG: SpoIIE family protein phosphatase [Candidatus Cloacimonetes bacterium]|nr:SpoIIE family protein phosphatase [Candidatus Cloacimonadota bacterium]